MPIRARLGPVLPPSQRAVQGLKKLYRLWREKGDRVIFLVAISVDVYAISHHDAFGAALMSGLIGMNIAEWQVVVRKRDVLKKNSATMDELIETLASLKNHTHCSHAEYIVSESVTAALRASVEIKRDSKP